ncbi:unnamed protein product, partial [Discosporangium mesarthrocarpum]
VNPHEADAWKRRGQTHAAVGHAVGAVGDLTRALELSAGRDPDVIHQRGMVYHKVKVYHKVAGALFCLVSQRPSSSWVLAR